MAVRKFRQPDELHGLRWLPAGDPRIPRRVRFLLDVARTLVRVHRVPGVHRYRSIEEANAAKDALRREPLARPLDEPRER